MLGVFLLNLLLFRPYDAWAHGSRREPNTLLLRERFVDDEHIKKDCDDDNQVCNRIPPRVFQISGALLLFWRALYVLKLSQY